MEHKSLVDLNLPGLLRDAKSCIVANPGNAGDALIAFGTNSYLNKIGASVETIPCWNLSRIMEFEQVIYNGGGNLVPLYDQAITLLQKCYDAGKTMIVLPHTTYGYEAKLCQMSSRLTIVCRDAQSFSRLRSWGFPKDKLYLDHDMAFSIPPEYIEGWKNPTPSSGEACCMRTDAESCFSKDQHPVYNKDISLCWNGDLWHNLLLAEAVTSSLCAFLFPYESVRTDRLHIGILGSLLGKQVKLYANSYYKNRSVFEMSKSLLDKVDFIE